MPAPSLCILSVVKYFVRGKICVSRGLFYTAAFGNSSEWQAAGGANQSKGKYFVRVNVWWNKKQTKYVVKQKYMR